MANAPELRKALAGPGRGRQTAQGRDRPCASFADNSDEVVTHRLLPSCSVTTVQSLFALLASVASEAFRRSGPVGHAGQRNE